MRLHPGGRSRTGEDIKEGTGNGSGVSAGRVEVLLRLLRGAETDCEHSFTSHIFLSPALLGFLPTSFIPTSSSEFVPWMRMDGRQSTREIQPTTSALVSAVSCS